jgi:hypothetical protein
MIGCQWIRWGMRLFFLSSRLAETTKFWSEFPDRPMPGGAQGKASQNLNTARALRAYPDWLAYSIR